MSKVVSIEIGYSLIKICELDFHAKSPRIYNSISVRTPENVMNDGELQVTEELVATIKGGLKAKNIRTKQVVFSITSTKIASREVAIPFVKESKIASLIETNAPEYFPVDMDQYEVGHTVLRTVENEKGVKQYRVLVLAAPKNLLEKYHQLATESGLSVIALDYSGNSIFQMIKSQCEFDTQMVVKMDGRATIITILTNQAIVLQRTVAYGIDDAIETYLRGKAGQGKTYQEALKMFRRFQCINSTMDGEDVEIIDELNQPDSALRMEITEAIQYLISSLARVVDFYNSKNAQNPIKKTYLTGMGGDLKGLTELLSNEIGLEFTTMKEVDGFNVDKYFKMESFGEYISCIGAAIAPLGFMGARAEKSNSIEIVPQKEELGKISILVCAGGCIIAAALIFASLFRYWTVSQENIRLQDRIRDLEPIKKVYAEYLQQQYTYNKLVYLYNSTVNPNEYLVEFIEEMEDKMPSSLNVQAFTANTEGITMSVTVERKSDAAKLIQQFRTFSSIGSVSVTSLADSGAVMNGQTVDTEGKVSFSVVLTYKGADETETPAVQTDTETEEAE